MIAMRMQVHVKADCVEAFKMASKKQTTEELPLFKKRKKS
jgi:hypothetical protein